MKLLRRWLLLIWIASGVTIAQAEEVSPPPVQPQPLPPVLREELRRAAIPASATAFFVQEVGPGASARPLLALNGDVPMNPASTMKLVTTYSALELLGPAFTWKTQILSTAPLKGDILMGDLILKGSGDPKLVVESLWLMLRQLRQRGVRSIKGDLVLDRSLFDTGSYDPARFDGDPLRAYNVGPDALLLNFKAVTLRLVPDAATHTVRVTSEPQLAGLNIGPVRYLEGQCGDWKTALALNASDPYNLRFAGGLPGACGEIQWNLSLLTHSQYVAAVFRSLWTELGGSLDGNVRDDVTPATARLLVEQESPSLADIVRDINKNSNNVMARQLYLALSAEVLRLPANTERSRSVVGTLLSNKGLDMPELVLENGSGLSRIERISAFSMGHLLLTAYASAVMPEFMSSLSLVGFDGTMRKHLKGASVAGQAHIKSGSLDEVRALAGYVLAKSGRRYAVVFFANHANAQNAPPVQDVLLQWVYDKG